MGQIAAALDLTIQAGATYQGDAFLFQNKATGNPIDITGYEARMQLRASLTDPTVVLDMKSTTGQLIITPLLGRIDMLLSSTVTSTLTPDNTTAVYVYGIELYTAADANVISLATGKVTVSPEVVRG